MLRQEKETPATESTAPDVKLTEGSAEKAKNELLQAETSMKENNFIPAIYHYMNTMTHAKKAIEEKKLEDNTELFTLINQSITNLLSIAKEQNDLFEKCKDDTRIKLALTLIVLCRIEDFKKNIPALSDEEKLNTLTHILTNKSMVIRLVGEQPEIARLYKLAISLSLKKQYDQMKVNELVNYEMKKATADIANTPTLFKPKQTPASIFNTPWKFGLASSIPGAAAYSMYNAGLKLALWGGFYGVIAGAIACYAGNKLAEYCKPKR